MKPKSPRVVELLNEALAIELTVLNTYFLHARMLDNWGLPKLGRVFYELSIGEMKDADELINRILRYDGRPHLQPLGGLNIGDSVEEMLSLAFAGEMHAVKTFNAAAQECHDLGDHATAKIFEEMALDEEDHADWFEGQLDALARVGVENYTAAQLEPGTGPAESAD